jgi:hypothetical protein
MSAAIVGSDSTVKTGLENLVTDTLANEVIVISDTYEHADRLQSYQLVANVTNGIRPAPAGIMNTAKH